MERLIKTGDFKRLYWTTGTVVPTGSGLRPALMAEEFDMEAWTEAEAFAFADFDKPWGSGGESFSIDAFGHEENSIHGDFGKFQKERFDFDQIIVA
jgi:hypothetical protein